MKSSSLSSSSFDHIIRNSHSQFLRRSISSVIRQKQYLIRPRSAVFPVREMASNQQGQSREELDAKARQGETVVPGGTGGKSLEAQEHLAEGRSRGGQTRKEQLGKEGYQEMGRKGGLSTSEESGEERAQREGIPIEESKFRTKR